MTHIAAIRLPILVATAIFASIAHVGSEQPPAGVHVRPFDLPDSAYLSAETRSVLVQHHELWAAAFNDSCGALEGNSSHTADVRACQASSFYKTEIYKRIRSRYPVVITSQNLAGVYTETFTPASGIPANNEKRILINLHGGGFLEGARSVSHLESIPITVVSGIRVISIDYRQAPEALYPAATEDVTAVYRQLLQTYAPESIGIYGCSAGGLLTAQVVAWLRKERLPRPGAIGMFCMGASYTGRGDSAFIARAIEGAPANEFDRYPAYFKNVDPKDPLAYPVLSNSALNDFPPSMLISATRDHALSSVLYTHSRLSALGISSELHVVEGLGHAFLYDPDLPESREMYALVSRFFDSHLKH
jgi:epsilon-lactone hydrolase